MMSSSSTLIESVSAKENAYIKLNHIYGYLEDIESVLNRIEILYF